MKRILKNILKLCFFIMFFVLIQTPILASNKSDVLFISSYNLSFETIPLQIEGINSVLTNDKFNIDYEFMDTKKYSSNEHILNFKNMIKYKINNRNNKYSAILVGDDAALVFAINYQEELFNEIPIIFFAINSINLANQGYNNPYMTGNIEYNDLVGTINLAFNINPNAKKIVGLVDNTLTGLGDIEQFYEACNNFKDYECSIINSSLYTIEEYKNEIAKINNDTIIIYLTMFEDKLMNTYSIEDSVKILVEYSNVPIYRASIGGIGTGLIGGKQVDYKQLGIDAANITLQIINGTPIKNVSLNLLCPSYDVFDLNVLKKFNISKDVLDEDIILLNSESIINYKESIIFISILAIIFSSLIVLISIDVIKNKYQKRKLRKDLLNVKDLAMNDELSKLPNRRCFQNDANNLILNNEFFSIMLIDLDNFKEINDTYGHIYGDQIIRNLGKKIIDSTTDNLKIYRVGGDEFIALYKHDNIEKFINEINNLFDNQFEAYELKIKLGFSYGIASFKTNAITLTKLIDYADSLMYKMKKQHKNRGAKNE